MSAVTFGDLARAATGHLDAAARLPAAGVAAEPVAAATGQGCRLAETLARYLDDLADVDAIDLVISDQAARSAGPAARAREALRAAAVRLRAAGEVFAAAGTPADPLAASLAAACGCLRAGHDLLATHAATGAGGTRAPASPWTAVVTSPEVTGALAGQVGRWSAQLAVWATRLLVATAGNPAIAARGPRGAVQHPPVAAPGQRGRRPAGAAW